MKSSEILREAARRVENGADIGGCLAINCATTNFGEAIRAEIVFDRYFYNSTNSGYWWPYKAKHGPRIIGLCLAAAIAESEGD